MRLLLPPSEGKTRPVVGPALELEGLLGAPALTPPREALIEELAALGDGPEAARVLGLGARSAQEAGLNLVLRTARCAPAHALYTGVLYEAAALREAAREPGAEAVLGKHIRDLTMPAQAVLIAVYQGEKTLIPHGDTVIGVGDIVLAFADETAQQQLNTLFK